MYPVRLMFPSSSSEESSVFSWLHSSTALSPIPKEHQLIVQIRGGGCQEAQSVVLDRRWTMAQCKESIKERLFQKADTAGDLRVIFAGKELSDDMMLSKCDLGQHSVLHVVLATGASSVQPQPPAPVVSTADEPLPVEAARSLQGPEADPFFYVFCSVCQGMKPGRIRVRCRACQELSLVVYRAPCDWDDVLIPARIQGFCHSSACADVGLRDAEFFFKCSEVHATGEDGPDETNYQAVPLDLICSNQLEPVPCVSCFEVTTPHARFRPCYHTFCVDCLIRYLEISVTQRSLTHDPVLGYTLPCPLRCADSLIREPHTFKLLSPDVYAKFQSFATEEFVLAQGGLFCPRVGCGMGLLPDCPPQQGGEGVRQVECPSCGFVFCRDCLREISSDRSHDNCTSLPTEVPFSKTSGSSFTLENRARWDEVASRVAIAQSTKPCPKCRTAVERSGGCMHMVCPRGTCNFEWCWVCCVEWNRDCMGKHWFG